MSFGGPGSFQAPEMSPSKEPVLAARQELLARHLQECVRLGVLWAAGTKSPTRRAGGCPEGPREALQPKARATSKPRGTRTSRWQECSPPPTPPGSRPSLPAPGAPLYRCRLRTRWLPGPGPGPGRYRGSCCGEGAATPGGAAIRATRAGSLGREWTLQPVLPPLPGEVPACPPPREAAPPAPSTVRRAAAGAMPDTGGPVRMRIPAQRPPLPPLQRHLPAGRSLCGKLRCPAGCAAPLGPGPSGLFWGLGCARRPALATTDSPRRGTQGQDLGEFGMGVVGGGGIVLSSLPGDLCPVNCRALAGP